MHVIIQAKDIGVLFEEAKKIKPEYIMTAEDMDDYNEGLIHSYQFVATAAAEADQSAKSRAR